MHRVQFRHALRPDLPAFPRLNVGSIIGGQGRDYVLVEPPYVPDLCTILVDVHFVPGQTVDEIPNSGSARTPSVHRRPNP